MRPLEIGVAIGEDVIAASWRGSEWLITLSSGPTTDAICGAIAELKRLVETKKRVCTSVAILPPLVQMRRIELPRMSEEDCRLAVSTNAQSHFFGLGQEPVCGVAAIRPRKREPGVALLAFAASSSVIESVLTGFEAVGWTIQRFVPAQAAWLSAVLRENPRLRRGPFRIGARTKSEINIVEVEAGSIKCVRRLRGNADFHAIAQQGPWHVVGTGELDQSVAMASAAAARLPCRCEIVSDSWRHARAARDRRITALFVLATFANLVVAAIAFRWRLEQQLALVTARRTAIHASASSAFASRDSVERLFERAAAMAELEQSAPRWSAVLSRVITALPADGELSSIRAEADSVVLDGQSHDASRVASVLSHAGGVKSARVTSPVVHEWVPNEIAVEHWHVAVRIDHQAATRP